MKYTFHLGGEVSVQAQSGKSLRADAENERFIREAVRSNIDSFATFDGFFGN
jgi:hypothetical protein